MVARDVGKAFRENEGTVYDGVEPNIRLLAEAAKSFGFFNLVHVHNKGAAFSFLATASAWRLPFFILVSSIALVVIAVVFRRLRPDQRFTAFSLALIFSGALGNLIDRVRLGEVIDFLDVHWYAHHWPAFNVADSAICVGVFLLAIDMYLEERRLKKEHPQGG